MRADVAGRDVTRHLRLLLRKEGVNFRTTAEFEIVRTIKEKACYLSANPQKEETLESDKQSFVLPGLRTFHKFFYSGHLKAGCSKSEYSTQLKTGHYGFLVFKWMSRDLSDHLDTGHFV